MLKTSLINNKLLFNQERSSLTDYIDTIEPYQYKSPAAYVSLTQNGSIPQSLETAKLVLRFLYSIEKYPIIPRVTHWDTRTSIFSDYGEVYNTSINITLRTLSVHTFLGLQFADTNDYTYFNTKWYVIFDCTKPFEFRCEKYSFKKHKILYTAQRDWDTGISDVINIPQNYLKNTTHHSNLLDNLFRQTTNKIYKDLYGVKVSLQEIYD